MLNVYVSVCIMQSETRIGIAVCVHKHIYIKNAYAVYHVCVYAPINTSTHTHAHTQSDMYIIVHRTGSKLIVLFTGLMW